jgi:hypothetical protein
MQIAIEAARALTYESSRMCDFENNNLRILEYSELDKDEQKDRKQKSRAFKRLNAMLTPMSKYYASEVCCYVSDTAIQVLGGSGYMKDYAAERYLRDARITTIYEGTSQLQIVAAVRGVSSGTFETYAADLAKAEYEDADLAALKEKLAQATTDILDAVKFVKTRSTSYLDFSGRRLVDSAITVICGHHFLAQAVKSDRKKVVAKRFITKGLAQMKADLAMVNSGDTTPIDEYQLLAGPVPSAS